MATISYDILNGKPPFIASLTPGSIPNNVHNTMGTFEFNNVPNGVYLLQIEDSNGCVFEKELTVDPFATTTTTTIIEQDALIVGNVQDNIAIFNEDATNRTSEFVGYPDSNTVTLFLWLKTLDGQPLSTQKTFSYEISSDNVQDGAEFTLLNYNNQIYSEINRSTAGPSLGISGDIILYSGFIEGYFEFLYEKNTNNRFTIDLNSVVDIFYPDLDLVNDTKIFGVTTAEKNRIVMQF